MLSVQPLKLVYTGTQCGHVPSTGPPSRRAGKHWQWGREGCSPEDGGQADLRIEGEHTATPCELIVSRYVAESTTMIAGRFGHVGLCQLHTVYNTQLMKAMWPKTFCNYCYWFCYVSAHDQFAQYWQSSNEPLWHHIATHTGVHLDTLWSTCPHLHALIHNTCTL